MHRLHMDMVLDEMAWQLLFESAGQFTSAFYRNEFYIITWLKQGGGMVFEREKFKGSPPYKPPATRGIPRINSCLFPGDSH